MDFREKSNQAKDLARSLPSLYLKVEGGKDERNPEYGPALDTLQEALAELDDAARGSMLFFAEQAVIQHGEDVELLFGLRSAEGSRRNAVFAIHLRKGIEVLDLSDEVIQDELLETGIARETTSGYFAINTGLVVTKALVAYLRQKGHNEAAAAIEATLPKPKLQRVAKGQKTSRQDGGARKSRQSRQQETHLEKFARLSAVDDIQEVSAEDVRDGKVKGLAIMDLPEYGKVIVTTRINDDDGSLFMRFQGSDRQESNELFGVRDGYLKLMEVLGVKDSAPEASADTSEETPEVEVNATPQAIEEADAAGLDISSLDGSGADDRVLVADVREAIAALKDADTSEAQEAVASTESDEVVEAETDKVVEAEASSNEPVSAETVLDLAKMKSSLESGNASS